VQGELEAHVRQLCVVTLEPVDSDLRVAIDEKFSRLSKTRVRW